MPINVLEELKKYKVQFEYEGDSHVKIKCPFHNDKDKPNMSVRVAEEPSKPIGFSTCFACGAKATFSQLLLKYQQIVKGDKAPTLEEIEAYLVKEYNLFSPESFIKPQVVDKAAMKIWEAGVLRKELYNRALSDETIREHKLGEDDGRITIPIFSESGGCVNIQKYSPGAAKFKFTNMRGRGELRLYPYNQLKYQKIVITGGPIKALAGAQFLNPLDIGCITAAGGEHDWLSSFNEKFRGKSVYICMDVDPAGEKAGKIRAGTLFPFVDSVKIIKLKFDDEEVFNKGGLDDFLANHPDRLQEILDTAEDYEPPQIKKYSSKDPAEPSTIAKAYRPESVNKRVSVDVNVAGVCETPCILPKTYKILCDRNAPVCALCPVSKTPAGEDFIGEVESENPALLEMFDKPDHAKFKAISKAAGIPSACKKHTSEVIDFQTASDIRISPTIDILDIGVERSNQPAIIVGEVEPNEDYTLSGRMFPHPDTQKATLVCSESEALNSDLTKWELEEDLSVFNPKEWTLESLSERVDQLYRYLGDEVLHVYRRPDMLMLMDLVYHSTIFFKMNGRDCKGWVEGLVIGDSSQGKSEASKGFRDLYSLGCRIDSKSATVAGLLGGNTQLGDSKKFFVKWGAIPVNDMGLVIIEEVGGMPLEVLSKLTDMRSEGIAQIPKIEAKSTKARTRKLWNSNPRSKRNLDTYVFGLDAISELIGAPPDIRRFDIAMAISNKDNDIRKSGGEYGELPTVEQFKACVRFAWTRTIDDVVISDDVYQLIRETSNRLTDTYVEDKAPLIDLGSAHLKVAKLSIALAARTGSVEGKNLIVRNCHVQYIEEFINRVYSDPVLGYKSYSTGVNALENVKNPKIVKEIVTTVPYPRDLVEHLNMSTFVDLQDFMDFGGIDRETAVDITGGLVRNRCLLRKKGNGYVKTPGFSKLLRKIENDGFETMEPSF